jgi:hypothetical protein
MIDLERRLLTHWPVSRLLIAGVVIAAVGYLPLQLYIAFGPRDGNPIGLGLLALVAVPAGLLVCAIGLVKLAVGLILGRPD